MSPQQGGHKQSFIPRKTDAPGKKQTRRGSSGIYFTAAVIIFVIAAAASGGVFFYERFLEQSIDSMATSLERAQAAFEPSLIRELKRVSALMDAANELLDSHVVLTVLFRHLGEKTLQSIRFNDFSYTFQGGQAPTINMSGTGRDYSAVAVQSDVFGEDQFIRNPVFSNLGLDQDGNVTFDVTASIDPTLISYTDIVE